MRENRRYVWKGQERHAGEIARMEGLVVRSLYKRLEGGMSIEEAVAHLKKYREALECHGRKPRLRKTFPQDMPIHDRIMELVRASGEEGISGREIARLLNIRHVQNYFLVSDLVYEEGEGLFTRYYEFRGIGK